MNPSEVFPGFPSRTGFTPIPNPFFSAILPGIRDIAELRVCLYIFWALYRKKGYPKFITYSDLRADAALMTSLEGDGASAEEALERGLKAAVERGTLITLKILTEGRSERLYFLNNEQSRRAAAQIESGQIPIGRAVLPEPASAEQKSNIFALYEQHIGLLTPMIVEDLKDAEAMYPAGWIEEAFREAVRLNKRSWRYISRILERWAKEGKIHGGARPDTQADISPKEYLKKYGHLTKR